MDFNALLSSLITSSNYMPNSEECSTTESTSHQPLSNEQELMKLYEKLTMDDNTKAPKRDAAKIELEATSPSQISPRLPSDCQSSLFSVESTDLSPYLMSGANTNQVVNENVSDDDDDTTTVAESIATVAESGHDDLKSSKEPCQIMFRSYTSDKSPENRSKLIRSNSFTVETPSFDNLPSCDLNERNKCDSKPTVNSFSAVGANDNRLPKWCLPVNYKSHGCFESPLKSSNKSPNSSFESPVVSSKAAQKTVELLKYDDFEDFDIENIEEQVSRLKDMQIMLAEYHKLQMDHLKVRQQSEVQTLQIQVVCMEKILSKLKSNSFAASSSLNKSSVWKTLPIKNYCVSPPNTYKTNQRLNSNQIRRSSASHRRTSSVILFKDGVIPEILKQKLAAYVKGFLLRRFLKVPKVNQLMSTVKDVRQQLITLSKEKHLSEFDCQFGEILLLQLKTALEEFNTFLFNTSLSEKLNLIATDRQRSNNQIVKFSDIHDNEQHIPKKLSSATLKRLTSKVSPNVSKSASAKVKRRRYVGTPKNFNSTKSPRKSPTSSSSSAAFGRQSLSCLSFNKSYRTPDKKPWR